MIINENLAIENYSDGITLKDKETVHTKRCIQYSQKGVLYVS